MAVVLEYLNESLVFTTLAICTVILLYIWTVRRPRDIPPGPPVYVPVIGNIPALLGKNTMHVFREFRKQYGDVFSVYMGHQLIIVLNGYACIKEALVRNGAVFCGRPNNPVVTGPKGSTGIVFSSGTFWKTQRKFVLNALQEFGGSTLESRITEEVHAMIETLETAGGTDIDLQLPITASVANVIFGILIGKRFTYDDEKFLVWQKTIAENAELIAHTSVIVNCFPWLKYIPGDPWKMKKPVENIERMRDRVLVDVYKQHLETFEENNIRDYMDMFIKEMRAQEGVVGSSFNYAQLLAITGDLLGAGSETTATTLRWALVYLTNNPDRQARMWTDINNVIGTERLATMSDMKHLPFVEAVILECMRIGNVAPLAVPHALETDGDVWFGGFRLPKDCNIIVNLDSILNDENLFENPSEFKPERFLNSSGEVEKPEEFIPFAIGRRVCAGEQVARMELFLFITGLIQAFEFLPPDGVERIDETGKLGITYKPKPFKLRIRKRD